MTNLLRGDVVVLKPEAVQETVTDRRFLILWVDEPIDPGDVEIIHGEWMDGQPRTILREMIEDDLSCYDTVYLDSARSIIWRSSAFRTASLYPAENARIAAK